MKSKQEVLASLAREYNIRKGYYAKQVAAGKMTQEAADHELACTQGAIIMVRTYAERPNEPLYDEFVSAYQTFAKKVLGLAGAPIGESESLAIASIIGKMRTMVPGGDAMVLQTWQAMLQPEVWALLNDFLRKQSTPVAIDRNIQEIIIKLKDAVNKKRGGFSSSFRPAGM